MRSSSRSTVWREPSAGSRRAGSAMVQHSLIAVAGAFRPGGIGMGKAVIAQALIVPRLALAGKVVHRFRFAGPGLAVHGLLRSLGFSNPQRLQPVPGTPIF